MNIPWKAIGSVLSKHAPSILTGVGIGGYITATVMAVRATTDYSTDRLVEINTVGKDEYGNRILDGGKAHKLTVIQEGILIAKHFWPEIIIIGGSTACVLLANSMNLQRQAALAAACSISETALKNYKTKAIEVLGPKEEQKQISDQIHKDYIEEHKEQIVQDRDLYPIETQIIIDEYSGTKFYLTPEDVRQAVNEFNARLLMGEGLPYGDLWDELYELSANQNKIIRPKGIDTVMFEFDYDRKSLVTCSFTYSDINGVPVSIVSFHPWPEVDYAKYMR